MEKMICSCCGAAIVPTVAQAFLTCEYCDSSVANPYYDAAAAAEAAKPDLKAICLKALVEMGTSENLDSVDRDCFGNPIHQNDGARIGLSIPDSQQMYFLYAHTVLLLGFSEGLALTDDGLYYSCGGEKGSRSWEAFVTGAISCVDRVGDQDGVLRIGSSVEIAVSSDKDSRLARFLVDFHNHVYHLYTGETAPAAWAVTEPAVSAAAAAEDEDPSLLGTILPAVGALLGGSVLRRTTSANRTVTMHSTGRPTIYQDRRAHVEPPRPLHSQPHHRPAQPAVNVRPGAGRNDRPGMGGPSRPGMQRSPGMGMSNRPGAQRGPDMSTPNRPGAQRGPGSGSSGRPGGMGGSSGKPGGRR